MGNHFWYLEPPIFPRVSKVFEGYPAAFWTDGGCFCPLVDLYRLVGFLDGPPFRISILRFCAIVKKSFHMPCPWYFSLIIKSLWVEWIWGYLILILIEYDGWFHIYFSLIEIWCVKIEVIENLVLEVLNFVLLT